MAAAVRAVLEGVFQPLVSPLFWFHIDSPADELVGGSVFLYVFPSPYLALVLSL